MIIYYPVSLKLSFNQNSRGGYVGMRIISIIFPYSIIAHEEVAEMTLKMVFASHLITVIFIIINNSGRRVNIPALT